MPVMEFRTSDDAYELSRLDYGAVNTGTTSAALGLILWNDKPTPVSGELLGTGNGTKTSFSTAFSPIVSDVGATVAIKVDGVAATGIAIDHANGVITFSEPPVSGAVVTCDYYYSVGSTDASAIVVTVEQVSSFAGDGSTKKFTLPTRCVTPLKLLVAGVEVTSSGYALQDSGDSLYISTAPAANQAVQFSYLDAVCQAGYYEMRSSGISNPFSQTGMSDDAEAAYYKLGGMFSVSDKLIGTGNNSTLIFSTGDKLIKTISSVKVGGVAVSDYSLNNVTGVVTLSSAPANNAEVRATYTYQRGHAIGNIKKWCARKCFLRVALPYDAPNTVLSTRIRVISQ